MSPRLFVDPERRMANFNNSYSRGELPPGTTQEVIPIIASDRAASVGVLHQPAKPTKVCCFYMHPRTNQTRPYLAPALLDAGIAVYGQMSRHVNNDIDMTHEEVLLDMAAGMRMLRDEGFEVIIGIGNSGGSSLGAYYQSQASRPPAERNMHSPGGEPTGFDKEDMPPMDFYVALALHLGEGALMLRMLDPAVVDERDPALSDPELDMFNPRNGYRPFPESSKYDPAWLERYAAAQHARSRRLDAAAHAMLADYGEARTLALADPNCVDSATARRALAARVMVIHRTVANPQLLDLSIQPSRRRIGGTEGTHPIRDNYGITGHGRILTPRAWLSTWSGTSSKAELMDTLPYVKVPSLFIWPDADASTTAVDAQAALARCGAQNKSLEVVEWGLHYLTAVPNMPEGLSSPKVRAGEVVVNWIKRQVG